MVGRRKLIVSRHRRPISPLTAPASHVSASSRVSNTWTTVPVASMARKRDVRIKAVKKSVIGPTIATHRGRMVKTTGDGMLVEFASAFDAMRCTVRPIARAACDAFLKA